MSRNEINKNCLSGTEAGVKWLKQFALEDVETARLLLESLVLVSNHELVNGITDSVKEFLANHDGLVAMYIAREVPEDVKYYWKKQQEKKKAAMQRWIEKLSTSNQFTNTSKKKKWLDFIKLLKKVKSRLMCLLSKKKKIPVTMFFEDSNNKPSEIKTSSEDGIGSEGDFAHLCRDLCKTSSRLLYNPSITEMKEAKCRWILCIDDIIASGKRMSEFAKWIKMHPTVNSWTSLGLTKFATVTFATTEVGSTVLKKQFSEDDIVCNFHVPYGRRFWCESELRSIERLCKKYAKRTSRKAFPLGFNNAFTFIVFSHKCPNTSPSILWAPSSGKWKSLFDGRPDIVLKPWPRIDPKRNQERILKALGLTRLCKPSFFSRLDNDSRSLLVLLATLSVKKRKIHTLSDILEKPQSVIIEMLEKCRGFGWINSDSFLTYAGTKTLEAARKNLCLPKHDVVLKDDFYFPKALRSSASSFSSGSLKGELP